MPITPKLAAAIKRYEARERPPAKSGALLISDRGEAYQRHGVDAMMDRLQWRVGFRVHAHAFRHTFATVATQLGWNFERLWVTPTTTSYSATFGSPPSATSDLGESGPI